MSESAVGLDIPISPTFGADPTNKKIFIGGLNQVQLKDLIELLPADAANVEMTIRVHYIEYNADNLKTVVEHIDGIVNYSLTDEEGDTVEGKI